MNSTQRFIRLDTPPPVPLDIVSLLFVLCMSFSVIVPFANWVPCARSYQSLLYFYEDEDGVADAESMRHNPNRIPVAVQALCLVLNVLLSLTRACVPYGSNNGIHSWLQVAMAVLLLLQGVVLCILPGWIARFHHGLRTGASCSVAAATLCVELYSQYTTRPRPMIQVALVGSQAMITTVSGMCALLLQRRPDVFHNGMMVDRRNTVSFLGLVAFSWTIPLLHASRANDNLSVHDLPELGYCSRAVNLFSSFLEAGEEYEAHRLWLTIFKSHAWSLVAQILLSLTSSFCIFLPRLALLGILQTLDTSVHQNSLRLWLYVAALGTTSVVSNTVTTWKYWTSVNIISMRVYAQLASVIYHKGLRLSGASAHDGYNADNTGDASQITINAVANDAKGIAGFVGDSYQLLETPIKLVCCCIFLLRLLGWQSVLAGLAIVFLCGPAQGYIAKWTVSTTISMLDCRDRRMSLVSELIQGIRQVKFLAAEEGWEERINRLRDREVNAASRTIRCNVFLSSIYLAEPILLAVVMLSMYSVTHPSPSASTAFTSITILSVMEQALDTLPALQMRLVNVVLFARRIEEYLQRPERVPFIVRSDRIELENATIVWPGSTTGLFDVSLQFPPGELSIISGPTGAGKSLLLSCLVGECELIGGTVFAPTGSDHPLRQPGHKWLVDDAVAYVAQSAWIETGTLRDNILFGCPYLPQRYEEVLFACALYPDIRLFPDGDRTEVGGNGVNLSGGQRSRLSLARALYSRAQTLIMDDIFSAVDVHTAKHLYEFALTGTLALGRTRILATYQVELCLSKAAYLVTLDKQGGCKGMPVTESQRAEAFSPDGTEEACFQPHDSGDGVPSAEGNLSERIFLDDYQSIRDTLLSRCDETSCCHAEMTRLSVASGGQVGSVQLKTMKDFFRLSGGVWHWTFVLSLFTVYGCLTLGRGYAIKLWTSQKTNSTTSSGSSQRYLTVYVAISGAAIVVGSFRNHATLASSLKGSAAIFRRLLYNILRARLRWLDTVPVGNLLSRFSADCLVVDLQIGNSLKQLLFFAFSIIVAIASGAIEAPILLLFAAVLLLSCFWCARHYVTAARQLKRLESSALGPIFDHMSSSAAGISTIRAFGRIDAYVESFLSKVDLYSRSFWHLWLLNRWMGFWMNILGAVFSTVTAVSMLSIPHVDSAAVGLAISFTMQLGDYLINLVQAYAALEMDMNSVHRLLEYTNMDLEDDKGTQPPATWPTECQLQVSNLVARYSPELPPVLRGITFDANPNERIGVVGRTGAGKSSLSLALMRFLVVEGDIRIDGVDISSVSLRRLRKVISLIPQSPVLFSGTLRSNLDPLEEYDDADLIAALNSVSWSRRPMSYVAESTVVGSDQFKADEESNPCSSSSTYSNGASPLSNSLLSAELLRPISEGGLNLSQGERQLLCLARALLHRPKLLILDESTSSVDKASDEGIQQTIRSELRHSTTLIVIAHRLRTIVDFDRILVLDQGHSAEFGTPSQLMKIDGGLFRLLVEQDAERNVLEEIIRLSGDDGN